MLNKYYYRLSLLLSFLFTSSIVFAQPSNDDPCNAISLTPAAACNFATYTNAGATATAGVTAPGCASYSGGDVWFSVTIPASGQVNINSNTGVITDAGMAVYIGTCAALTLVECDDDDSPNGLMSFINYTGTPGTTLFIRFWEYGNNNNGTFGICAQSVLPTCSDGIMNQNETGIDCGGVCPACPTPTVQDCDGAIPVCQNVYSENTAYGGEGNYPNEINSGPSCLGSGELNDVWYTFSVINSGNLCFTIEPNTPSDDYDWGVYDVSTSGCADIYTNAALEVGCNYSGVSGNTGPNGNAGSQNEPCIAVNTGETYVVNVSQFSVSTDGYTLDFGASTASIFDNVPPEIETVDQPIACGATALGFHFTENILCSSIQNGDFQLNGPGGPYTLSGVTGPNCASGGTQEDDFTITVSPPLTTSGNFQLCLTNSNGSVTDLCGNTAPPSCLNFTINNGIVANAGNDQTMCAGGTAVNIGGAPSATGGSAPLTYTWTPATGLSNGNIANPTASPAATTTYTLTVTDANGCQAEDQVTITVTPAPTVTVNSGTICVGDNIVLNASGMNTYNWTPSTGLSGTTGNSVTASPASTQTYTVTGSTPGCPNDTETATVTVNPLPNPNFSITGNQCLATNSVTFSNTGTAGTYSWAVTSGTPASGTNNTITSTFANAGTYNVTLTTTVGTCSNSQTLPVVINPNPTVVVTPSPVLCNGDCTGSITAVASGTSGYSYNWGAAGNGATLNGQCAAPYTVTVTDINGCQVTGNGTITEPPALVANDTPGTINCNGETTTVTVTATGGTAPYSGTGTFTVGEGAYSYTVTDFNNCTSTVTGNITEPAILTATATPGTIDCNGGTTTVTVAATGGTPPYSGTGTFTVGAGAYSYTVTDFNNCTSTVTGNITEPAVLTATANPGTILCNGGTTSVTVTASGGTGPYTGTGTFTVGAGAYSYTVTDFNNCTSTVTGNITEPAPLTATIAPTAVSCNGDCDGQATVTAGGGSGTYNYLWDNTTSDNTAITSANLCAGTYNVVVSDAALASCTVNASITVTEPTAINLSFTATPANCGVSDGTATITATGGSGTYTNYQWTPAPGGGQGTSAATGLSAGGYSVTVTDDNNCTETIAITVANNTAPSVSEVMTSHVDVDCFGANTGAAEVSGTGGTGTLTYAWTPTGGTASSANGLSAGTYTVTVTDDNNCSDATTITITEPTILNAVANVTANATCNLAADGVASVNVSGGTTAYTYEWLDAGGNTIAGGTGATISALTVGDYSITITDANNCTFTSNTITITEPAPVTGAGIETPVLCNGNATGSIDLTPAGGDGTYTYAWTGSAGYTNNVEDPTNLVAGTYNVTITDGNSCTGTTSVVVTEPTLLTLTANGNDAHCGLADGDVTAVGADGTGLINYSWYSDAALTNNIGNGANLGTLAAGTYYVEATDANGCTISTSVTINDLAGPTITATVNSDATGPGLCNGNATGTGNGGTGALTYSWDNGNTNATAADLCQGSNCVTVTDAAGCTATECVTINEPTGVTVLIDPTHLLCNGVCIGEADVTATGGVGGYTYLWNHGPTAEDLTGLCAGTFTVTVTDANGNVGTETVVISEPDPITITSTSAVDALCFGSCDGSIDAAAIDGTGTLSFEWFDATATSIGNVAAIGSLCAGSYDLVVTDDNGCIASANETVAEPTDIIPTPSAINSNCGQADGSVSVTVAGGTVAADYTYSWSDASSNTVGATSSITNLVAGTYSVLITDDNGCSTTTTATISDLGGATLTETHANTNCNSSLDGSINLTVTGGTAPFTYAWTGPTGFTATTQDLNGLAAGTYDITITDAVNCAASLSIVITEPTPIVLSPTSISTNCFGSSDGEVNATATGGTGAINFNWYDDVVLANNIGTAPSLTGLLAGTYYVTATDANGCSENSSIIVSEPDAIVVTVDASDANCGQADGSISVTNTTGGSGTYTSTVWLSGVGNPVLDINAVSSGTYDVTVTDDLGCTGTASIGVNDLVGPSVSLISASSTSCADLCDATALVTVTGGTSGYTYSWTPAPLTGQGTSSVTGLCAGDYTATVTDANGCIDNILITILEPDPLVVTIATITDVSINGGSDGTITSTTAGGTPAYSYEWYNGCPPGANLGQSTADASALPFGDYSVIVTDSKGCQDTACASVNEPTTISIIDVVTNTTCFNGCDGEISVTASGGVPGYTYDWFDATNTSIGQNGDVATNLCAGDYYVVVNDQNGASQTSSTFTVDEPAQIAITTSVTSNFNGSDISCNGLCDGVANAAVTGGTAPFTFAWGANTGNQTGANANNLCDGTYTVSVTDNNGCIETQDIVIVEPSILTNTPSQQDVSCNNACDGSLTATPAGATGPYSFQWNDPALSTSQTVNNLCAGNYNVTITDNNGCAIIDSYTVTEPIALVLNSATQGSNCGQNDGSATVTVVSGVGPYTYLWDINAGGATTPTASNLFSGCYDVTVTDANGCSELINICVQDLGAPTITLLTQTDVSCSGGNDGFAQIQVTNGNAPYTYDWTDCSGNSIGQTTASAFNLPAGCYTGSMVDNVGCAGSISVTITEPTVLNSAITGSTDVSCFGFCDGTASVTAGGGTPPYTYSWNDASNQSTATATGLCPGNYSVDIIDVNLCTQTLNVTINEPAEIILATSAVDAFCNTATGSATVDITSGGVGTFSYLWSPGGQTTQTATNVIPGTYSVQVTDGDGCIQNETVTVGDIPAGTAIIGTINNVSCNGGSDGEIDVSMSGTGTAPYTYQWFTSAGTALAGQTNALASGLIAGDFYVEVTDANGCISTSNTDIVTEPTILSVILNQSPVLCNGDCSGQAQAFPSGGTAPYSYNWDDALNQNTGLANSLCAQQYNVTVTDNNGCTTNGQIDVTEPTAMQLDSSVTNANCGLPDGSGCVTVSGGIAPYTYLWPDGGTNSCHIDLLAGSYLVEVTDANGCVESIVVEIQDLNGPVATITNSADALCFNDCNGSATVAMTGGTGTNFSVIWDANALNQTTPTASNLCAGTYTVTITDDLGCNASTSINIAEPAVIQQNINLTQNTCFNACDGEAEVIVIGGTTPYSYSWLDATNSNIGTGNVINALCASNYGLNITDNNGCIVNVDFTITEPVQVTGSTAVTDVQCFGACDGTAIATGANGVAPYTFAWDAGTGNQTSTTAASLCPGVYDVVITDANGCTGSSQATITEPDLLTADIDQTGNITCNNACDGFAQVSVGGGTPNYQYSWSNNSGTAAVATNLCAGSYTVTITDANGCIAMDNTTLTQPQVLTASSSVTNLTCFQSCDGSGSVSPSGGTAPFSFQWNNSTFATTSSFTNECSGTYTCVITDANNCEISKIINITQPNAIQISANITSSNCGQDNGQICTNTNGGTAPYSFQWNDPNTQTGACALNLLANCYNFTVTDANACVSDTLLCINDIAGPTVTNESFVDVTCFGAANGSVEFSTSGGTGLITTQIIDQASNNINTGTTIAVNLDGGCYTLIAEDAAGCIASNVQCVAEPNALNSAVVQSTDALCNLAANGTANAAANGGSTPYTFSWNGGATPNDALNSGLAAGNYTVTITDINGCTSQSSVLISEPAPLDIAEIITDVSCFGGNNGGIDITASGGTPFYLYTWTPNAGSGPNIGQLGAGNYSISLTDANACTYSENYVVNEPTALAPIISGITNPTCEQCNGALTVTTSGGTPNYTYQWTNGATPGSSANTGFCAGTQTLTITDAAGCIATVSHDLINQASPSIDSIIVSAPSCFGTSTGSATVYGNSDVFGTGNFLYTWDANASNQNVMTAVALADGNYCVTITDPNGCVASSCTQVIEPNLLVGIPDGATTICYGEDTQIWASGQGGTTPYNISWLTPGPAGTGPISVDPLVTTNYCFRVTDANGCASNDTCIEIQVRDPLAIDLTPSTFICADGDIDLTALASGGDATGYTFDWVDANNNVVPDIENGNQSEVTVGPTSATWYYVTLSDGCSIDAIDSTEISVSPNPVAFLSAADSSGCEPFNALFIGNSDIGVTYEFDIDCDGINEYSGTNSNFNYTFNNDGIYDVCMNVISADGCATLVSSPGLIEVFPLPVANFTPTPANTTFLTPYITFTDNSTEGVSYNWDFGDTYTMTGGLSTVYENQDNTDGPIIEPTHTFSDTGYYDVLLTIETENGCISTYTETIFIEGDYTLYTPNAFTPDGDGRNDTFKPLGIGIDRDDYQFLIFNRWGQLIYEAYNPDDEWDGTYENVMSQQDVYVWILKTRDHEGNPQEYQGHVTLVR